MLASVLSFCGGAASAAARRHAVGRGVGDLRVGRRDRGRRGVGDRDQRRRVGRLGERRDRGRAQVDPAEHPAEHEEREDERPGARHRRGRRRRLDRRERLPRRRARRPGERRRRQHRLVVVVDRRRRGREVLERVLHRLEEALVVGRGRHRRLHERLDGEPRLGGRGVALGRALGEEAVDDGLERRGVVELDVLGEARWLAREVAALEIGAAADERRAAGEQFEEERAARVEVGRRVAAAGDELLGRGVGQRVGDRLVAAAADAERGRRVGRERAAEADVEQGHPRRGAVERAEEDVGRLEVEVGDVGGVGVVQRVEHAAGDRDRLGGGEAPTGGEGGGERLAFEELHHDEDVAARRQPVRGDGDEPRVAQRRRRPRRRLQRRALLVVVDRLHLDRDPGVAPRPARLPHRRPVAADPDQRLEHAPADRLAGAVFDERRVIVGAVIGEVVVPSAALRAKPFHG
ncbi:MAG: hypothetical protein H6703_03050 [Myxococcales bacterium]|nr:hypothetical protein [Myxococcales bacterium]